MTTETGTLQGRLIRLERLELGHVDGLAAAAAEDPSLYRWRLRLHGGRPELRFRLR
jgi:hypothetical protein